MIGSSEDFIKSINIDEAFVERLRETDKQILKVKKYLESYLTRWAMDFNKEIEKHAQEIKERRKHNASGYDTT